MITYKAAWFVFLGIVTILGLAVSFTNLEDMKKCLVFISRAEQSNAVSFPPCVDRKAATNGRVEDIFCMRLPPFLTNLTNPCFYDFDKQGASVLRCLPYFYVFGMDKCGSTDLHSRIMIHPDIRGNRGSLKKETQFWSWSRYGLFNKNRGNRYDTLNVYMMKFQDTAKEI